MASSSRWSHTSSVIVDGELVKATYVKLWTVAERHGSNGRPTIHVGYNGITEGEGGRFTVSDDGTFKTIHIDRPFYDASFDQCHAPHWHRTDGAAVDVVRELCILAHEHGHALSWEQGHWIAYTPARKRREEALAGARISATDHAIIMAEEKRAWDLGRTALESLGWFDWPTFDRARADALKTYEDIAHA